MPIYEQLLKITQFCHSLSEMFQDILLFLYDDENNQVLIIEEQKWKNTDNNILER